MATVQLADVYNPLTFARREQEAQIELNRFLTSGVLVQDPRLNDQASVGGDIGGLAVIEQPALAVLAIIESIRYLFEHIECTGRIYRFQIGDLIFIEQGE